MEALTAFSLAGTVLEFSRFGLSLLRDSRELYKSSHGALSGNEQLELATADLRALLVKLKGREGSGTKMEEEKVPTSFQHILCGAEYTANELLRRLERLKIRGDKSDKWEIVQTAIQNHLGKSVIEALTKKLERFKDAVQPHVLFSILENLDQDSLRTSSRFDHLDEKTQLIISSLLGNATNPKETTAVMQEIQDQMATLIQLVCRIDTINTNEHHRTRTKIINEQIQRRVAEGNVPEHPGTLKKITARFEMLDVSDAEEIKLRRNVQDDILKTLMYPAMTERYEDIGEAFPQTFEWAFKDSTTKQARWDNLSEWLMTGSGVYWISGKAGSGKSTLMKHIFEDFRTRKYLEQWAQGEADGNLRQHRVPFCLATFFFWNSGTPVQKSQHGLLRALLYQVLSSWPELIPVVFPDLWAWRYSDSIQGQSILHSNFDKGALIRGRLTSAFRKLTQQTLVPLKLCFLVDGIDEFDGDHEELASLFKLATNSPTVKICCSSRPWVILKKSMALARLCVCNTSHTAT